MLREAKYIVVTRRQSCNLPPCTSAGLVVVPFVSSKCCSFCPCVSMKPSVSRNACSSFGENWLRVFELNSSRCLLAPTKRGGTTSRQGNFSLAVMVLLSTASASESSQRATSSIVPGPSLQSWDTARWVASPLAPCVRRSERSRTCMKVTES